MRIRGTHPAVLATAVATFGSFLGIGIVDPILPSIARELGASHFMVMFLFTSYLLIMGLANLVAGALATRIGSRRTLVLGLSIVAVFSGACALVSTVEALSVLRGFWGLGNALFTTTALSIIVGVANKNTERAIGYYEASLGFGIACGPLLGGVLGTNSWRLPFVGASVIMVLAIAFVVMTVREPATERKQGVRDVVETYRHSGVRTAAIVGMLYTFGYFTLFAYTPLILGVGTVQIGLVFFVWGLLLVVGSTTVSPRLNPRYGITKVTSFSLVLFGALLALMWLSTDSMTLSVLVVLGGLLCGMLNANLTTLAMGVSDHGRSVASGAFNSLRFIGGAFAPITAGLLGQTYGETVPFVFATAVVLAGAFVLLTRFDTFAVLTSDPVH